MKFTKIGVVGAGQMGSGIAHALAAAGIEAMIWDQNQASVKTAITQIQQRLDSAVSKDKISRDVANKTLSLIKPCESIQNFKDSELVIEAIVENLAIKVELFKQLELILDQTAIIASNTSSISITKMAAGLKNPERFIGIHFMNPVPVMQLVEIIPSLQSSETTLKASYDLVNQINKTAVKGIDSPGFIVNRVLVPMINEAIFLLQEGVTVSDIDTAMKLGTNQPMGPLELADFVGLDTLLYILKLLHSELGEDKYRPCPLLSKYVDAGWLGRKTKKGFYTY